MKLNQLKEGYIIIKSPKKDEYSYATPSSTYSMGIYSSGGLRSSGETKVFVHGVAKKGSKVRSRLNGDGGQPGQAVIVTDGFATSHLQIGTALEAGRDKLISVLLDIRYVTSTSLGTVPVFTSSQDGLVPHPGSANNEYLRDDGTWATPNVSGGLAEAFETVSKNLKSYPYVITYNGDDINYITYNLGGGDAIVKTFHYTIGVLTSIVLSGDTPLGITLTKTLSYTGDDLTSVVYS
jgi:hypothetical protein